MGDIYEKARSLGSERPEYVLKNGKAINVYGLMNDVIELQRERDVLKGKLEKALQAVQFYANQTSYSSSWDPAKRNPIHAMEDKGRVAKNALSSIFDERLG